MSIVATEAHKSGSEQLRKRAAWSFAQLAVIWDFFFASNLSREQRLELQRLLLRTLPKQAGAWIGVLTLACICVWIFGDKKSISSAIIWTLSLVALLLPYGLLARKSASLPDNAPRAAVTLVSVMWCIWLTVVASAWLAGNWVLVPQPSARDFHLAQQTFVYITVMGQVVTLICLSPNRAALFCTIALGTAIPFNLFIKDQLVQANERLTHVAVYIFFDGQLALLLMASLILAGTQRRLYTRQVLLEAESARSTAEWRRAEWERERAEAERERANSFIMTVGHDLKQPLQAAALRLASLKRKIRFAPDLLDLVEEVQRQNMALEEMVHASFDLSRLEAGTWEVDIREVVLMHLIRQVTDELRKETEKRCLMLEIKEIPPYLVRTDPNAMRRILRNLVGNAVKYTPAISKEEPGCIVIDCHPQNELMCVSVSDNGIGIPQNRIKDIVKPYVQLNNPGRERTKGFGLGLSIVDRLIKLLDGHSLDVRSTEGHGSCFSVKMPIAARIPAELLPGGSQEKLPNLKDMVVAIIEDDPSVREAMSEWLVDWGCYVVQGSSADETLASMRMEQIETCHLILADYRLEEGTAAGARTGLDAIKAVRDALLAPVPAAVWTAESTPELLQRIAIQGIELLPKAAGSKEQGELLTLLAKYSPHTMAQN